jgi:type I restriction-modification system DNA methylase subunit
MPQHITQQQLESYLWRAATLLRGTIDAGDYKQFIFPLLFYKRLCDVFGEETQMALAESDGDEQFSATRSGPTRIASLTPCYTTWSSISARWI